MRYTLALATKMLYTAATPHFVVVVMMFGENSISSEAEHCLMRITSPGGPLVSSAKKRRCVCLILEGGLVSLSVP